MIWPGQVDGDGVVDGNVVGVGGDVADVQDVISVPELHQGILIGELYLCGGAAHKAGEDYLARMNLLSAAVDDAFFDKGEDAGADISACQPRSFLSSNTPRVGRYTPGVPTPI